MGLPHEDLEGLGPFERERHAPLVLRYDLRRHHAPLARAIGGSSACHGVVLAITAESQGRGRPVSYSRRKGHYPQYHSATYQYGPIVNAVDYLDAEGLIQHTRMPPGPRGVQSYMVPTPELIDIVKRVLASDGKPKLMRPQSGVILRGAGGETLPFLRTREHDRMQRRLDRMNEAIDGTDISGMGAFGEAAHLIHIFNRDFKRNGRAYCVGGGWQSLPKEDRRRIQINGEATVELDFKTLHPAVLYSRVGAPLPEDCYAIGHWPRGLVKIVVLILINATTVQSAIAAIAHHSEMAGVDIPGSGAAMRHAAKLVEEVKRAHAPIARYFHSDAGAWLMRWDAEVAMSVMLEMSRQGEVVLAVHDSFIVRQSQANRLEEAMFKAAYSANLTSPKIVRS